MHQTAALTSRDAVDTAASLLTGWIDPMARSINQWGKSRKI